MDGCRSLGLEGLDPGLDVTRRPPHDVRLFPDLVDTEADEMRARAVGDASIPHTPATLRAAAAQVLRAESGKDNNPPFTNKEL